MYVASKHLTPRLQKRVSGDDLEEALQTFAAMLDDVVAEPVGENLPWQWGYRDTRAFALEDIAEILEIRVTAAHDGVFQFEGGDVGPAHNLVRRVHVAGCAMGLGVADFYLEEVLGRSVDLLERLLSRFWDGLHRGGVGGVRRENLREGERAFILRMLG